MIIIINGTVVQYHSMVQNLLNLYIVHKPCKLVHDITSGISRIHLMNKIIELDKFRTCPVSAYGEHCEPCF